jgi:pilus assembly protein CpaC
VAVHQAGLLDLPRPAKRISVGNADIADILILRSRQLYVLGKALGTTNVVVWDSGNRVFASFNVEVTHDLGGLKRKLYELLPGENIRVHSSQDRIVLSGEVSSLVRAKAAEDLASSFLPPDSGQVLNMMTIGGGQQVMLSIKVAEVNRTLLRRLDNDVQIFNFGNNTKWGAVNGGSTFPNAQNLDGGEAPIFGGLGGRDSPIGPVVDRFEPSDPSISDTGLFLSHLSGDWFFQAVMDISRRKGLAKVLAEPTLLTMSGQEAQFLAGGEFPVPVDSGDDAVSVDFKEFGVGLFFLPVVLDSSRISLRLDVSVSELADTNPVIANVESTLSTFVIPSLNKRSASTTVELGDGQTIGIAGLIQDNVREFVQKLPGIGDVPGLGNLFRSQEFVSGQTELVMFVTPRLAKPIQVERVKLPTDSFVAPSDVEFYLMGRMEARRAPEDPDRSPAASSSSVSGGAPDGGRFGHQL